MFPALKNNAAKEYKGPLKTELLKGAGPLHIVCLHQGDILLTTTAGRNPVMDKHPNQGVEVIILPRDGPLEKNREGVTIPKSKFQQALVPKNKIHAEGKIFLHTNGFQKKKFIHWKFFTPHPSDLI